MRGAGGHRLAVQPARGVAVLRVKAEEAQDAQAVLGDPGIGSPTKRTRRACRSASPPSGSTTVPSARA
jgi:hypothetical protein